MIGAKEEMRRQLAKFAPKMLEKINEESRCGRYFMWDSSKDFSYETINVSLSKYPGSKCDNQRAICSLKVGLPKNHGVDDKGRYFFDRRGFKNSQVDAAAVLEVLEDLAKDAGLTPKIIDFPGHEPENSFYNVIDGSKKECGVEITSMQRQTDCGYAITGFNSASIFFAPEAFPAISEALSRLAARYPQSSVNVKSSDQAVQTGTLSLS